MRLANEWLPCSVHMGLEIQSGPVPSRAPPATRITHLWPSCLQRPPPTSPFPRHRCRHRHRAAVGAVAKRPASGPRLGFSSTPSHRARGGAATALPPRHPRSFPSPLRPGTRPALAADSSFLGQRGDLLSPPPSHSPLPSPPNPRPVVPVTRRPWPQRLLPLLAHCRGVSRSLRPYVAVVVLWAARPSCPPARQPMRSRRPGPPPPLAATAPMRGVRTGQRRQWQRRRLPRHRPVPSPAPSRSGWGGVPLH